MAVPSDTIGRLGRFAGIGGLATLVHVTVALALGTLFPLPDLAANLAGVLTAMSVSYFGHLHVTFGVRPAHATQVPRFLMTALSALCVSSAVVAGVTAAGGSFAVAMALVMVTVPLASYLLFHRWVFAERAGARSGAALDIGAAAAGAVLFPLVFWDRLLNHDVVWYHVAVRKWHDGARLYHDILEVNPPLNFYFTRPVTALADLTGLTDSNAQLLVVAALIFGSLLLVATRLRVAAALDPGPRAALVLGLGAVLTLVALRDAAQREHLMVILFLPWITAMAYPAGLTRGSEAGLAALAAIAMCLKPFFVVFPLALLLLRAGQARRPALLVSVSGVTFLVTGLAYVGAVAVLHPVYLTDVVPTARIVYGALSASFGSVMMSVALPLTALCLAGVWTLTRPLVPSGAVAFFTVAGAGVISYVWQSTGFSYHAVPYMAFGLAGCLFALTHAPSRAIALLAIGTVSLVSVERGFYTNGAVDRIVPVVAAEGPVDSLLVVTSHVFAGPIVAVEAGADWANDYPHQWLVPGALKALARTDCTADPARCRAIEAIADRNRADLIASMRRHRPEMIVFDKNPGYFAAPHFDWHGWLGTDPAYAGILAAYSEVSEDDRFTYWVRRAR